MFQDLWVSTDNGHNWSKVKEGVDKAVWGILPVDGEPPVDNPDTPDTIYFTFGAMSIDDIVLQRCKSRTGVLVEQVILILFLFTTSFLATTLQDY